MGQARRPCCRWRPGCCAPTRAPRVHGLDVWRDPLEAKRLIGNLADGVDLFDRLTGEQLITFTGLLFSLDRAT